MAIELSVFLFEKLTDSPERLLSCCSGSWTYAGDSVSGEASVGCGAYGGAFCRSFFGVFFLLLFLVCLLPLLGDMMIKAAEGSQRSQRYG